MDNILKESKKNDKLIRKHQAAYRLGLLTDSENTYPVKSEKYFVFNIGRLSRVRANKVGQ